MLGIPRDDGVVHAALGLYPVNVRAVHLRDFAAAVADTCVEAIAIINVMRNLDAQKQPAPERAD